MKNFTQKIILALALLATAQTQLLAQGTAFTYQGRLNDNGAAVNGNYDFRFALFDATNSLSQQGNLLTNSATAVSNGLFIVTLDFGNQFPGAARWLEIAVRTNGGGAFATLAPRQPLTPTPYAIYAPTAGTAATAVSANSISSINIIGAIPLNLLPAGVLTNGATGVNLNGTFGGNGAGVTNVSVNSLVPTPAPLNVVAWGNNSQGQTNVPPGMTNVLAASAGGLHSLAVLSNGTVVAWGYNKDGQINVPAGLNNAVAVAAGSAYSLALKSTGIVIGWGNNISGQATPPVGLTNVIAIAAGEDHTLALVGSGAVVAWGNNGNGQTNVPAGLGKVIAVAAGQHHSLVLKINNTVAAWGLNTFGQTTIPAGATNVIAVAAGYSHSLALRSDGTVVAWGDNSSGESTVPVGLTNVISVAAGVHFSLALKPNGKIVTWGNNTYGQTSVGASVSHITALAPGSSALHALAVQMQFSSWLVAMLDWPNVLSASLQINNAVGINTSNFFENALLINTNTYLFSHPIFLRGENGPDHSSGLAYADTNSINFFNPWNFGTPALPNGPVLWGPGGGSLGIRNGAGDFAAMTWSGSGVVINGNLIVNGSINPPSDRNVKQDFKSVAPAQILSKVLSLPVTEWSYKTDVATRHIGPMAQDFYSAFAVGMDDKHIATVDESGVALAAIQGLNEKLESENAELRARLEKIERLLKHQNQDHQ